MDTLIVSLGIVAGFFVLREHSAHALGLAPYALLLACPLLHLFHGHGSHKSHADHRAGSDMTFVYPADWVEQGAASAEPLFDCLDDQAHLGARRRPQ